MAWSVKTCSYSRSELLSVLDQNPKFNEVPTLISSGMACSDSTESLPLPFKFEPSTVKILHADYALTLSRKRSLTFLKTQAPGTSTYTYKLSQESDPPNNPMALLSLSLPDRVDDEDLRGSKIGAFSSLDTSASDYHHSGGHHAFVWIERHNDVEKKTVKLWSDNGPSYLRNGVGREGYSSSICTIRLPDTVAIDSIESIVLDEIYGRIFLVLADFSITILSFI